MSKKQHKQQKIQQKQKDKRFQSATYDPKFHKPSQNISKIKIDKRFTKMMTDPQFRVGSQEVDKYGRKNNVQNNKKKQNNVELQEYYYMDENQDANNNNEQQEIQKQIQYSSDNEGSEEEREYVEEEEEGQSIGEEDRMAKWMENYNQSSEEEEMDQNEEEEEDLWSENQGNQENRKDKMIKGEHVQATRRLALCNYDWMNITSKDLMILFNSFKPISGAIQSIAIYYSEFGKQRMEEQEQYGPRGVWADQNGQVKPKQQEQNKKQNRKSRANEQISAFNENKLRKYEKQRLKFCYAVISCDSSKTADEIYRECDGNQFQNSNLLFDLRFIPDELELPEEMKKQECSELPISGEVKNFVNRAMGHSKISLTWQDPELSAIASLKNKNWNTMTEKDMDKIDWSMYINQDDVQNNENNQKLMRKRRKTSQIQQQEDDDEISVDQWRKQCNKKYRKKQDDELQITFQTGFGSSKNNKPQSNKQSLNNQIKSRKERWRKNQEIKQKRKLQEGQTIINSQQQSYEAYKNKDYNKLVNGNYKKKHINRQNQRSKLQLLVNKESAANKQQFNFNAEDDRFKAVFENPLYSINPTDPKFDHRKTGKAFEQVVKRNKRKNLQ